METFDIGVVGGGVMGLSVLREAVAAGRSAVLFERGHVGHPLGSSHGPARAFATPHLMPELVEPAGRAGAIWRELAEHDPELYWAQGAMLRTARPAPVADALAAAGLDHEVLEPAAVERTWPGLTLGAGAPVVYTPDGGTLRADRVLALLRKLSEAGGGVVREGVAVHALAEDGDSVVLETALGPVRVGHAVVAAASWTPELVAPWGLRVAARATRQTVVYVHDPGARTLPALFEEGDPSKYWVSSADTTVRLGMDDARAPEPVLGAWGEPDPVTVETLMAHVRARLPQASAAPIALDTCLFTHTGGQFVIERSGPVTAAVACEGRGFKFAPLFARDIVASAVRVPS
ncbi:FAD-dependent oxidoreductase [Amycolatopsis rhabdoformis]|uniref:FAD-dependent oxidoreductase n=1 Tax=Amycolatopsis rhabdoformis TaxID=1448059 RepID=A0ABZ1II87_9PSEU|nr:FAD-dependent oxidoreductase [Amycolatopsis rhabdoformis]WSE33883.1 FAD-dependent oxidoreductase [Amycolatopsis rhabdoformis]